MAIKSLPAGPGAMPESLPMEPEDDSSESDGATAIIDAAMLGKDVKPGDRIELEVVSVDPEMGSVTVKATETESEDPEEGIDSMAAEYDNAPA